MGEANSFSFSNLFLLVGTNPLPNLVVTEYLLKNNPALTEIHLLILMQGHSGLYRMIKIE